MQLAVRSSGYDDAAGALLDANQRAETVFGRLVDPLSSASGFAGDDSFAGAWAATYDESAASVLTCFAELVGALGNLSHLTEVSGLNHRRADEASIIVRPGLYVGGASSHVVGDRSVTVSAPSLPSALGGDGGNAPWWWDKAFDAVEGLVWPDADCSMLRSVGEEWRRAASQLEQLGSYVDVASHLLEEQRSPEIPAALATLADVRAAIEQVAVSLRELGNGCRDHAAEVEKHRDMIVEIGKDFLVEAGVTQALTWGLTALTLGGSQAVGQSAQAVRVAMYAARIRKVLASLTATVALRIGPLRSAGTAVAREVPMLRRVKDARVLHASVLEEAAQQAVQHGLAHVGKGAWRSPAGVIYARNGNEHRLVHLLKHAYSDLTRPKHSVFAEGEDVVGLVDKAWMMKTVPVDKEGRVFMVDFGKPIGTRGETMMRVVFERKGSSEIVTAYPAFPRGGAVEYAVPVL